MKTLLLASAVVFAGCSKKSEDAPAPAAGDTTLSKGSGPVADLQMEFSTDKSKKGQPVRVSGMLLNFGAAPEGGNVVTLIDRKTQKRPSVECFTKTDLDALKLEQFDKLIVEGTLAESSVGKAEIRDCSVTREP